MGFEWPLETEPAEALPINANDFLGAWQTGANSPSGRQSAQSTAHASHKAVSGPLRRGTSPRSRLCVPAVGKHYAVTQGPVAAFR